MDVLKKQLEQAGLTEREAAIYFASLQLGPASVLVIAKKANMKRPTAYLVLDELVRKGLVSLVPKEKRKLFIALSPERIIENLEEKSRSLREALPDIMNLFKDRSAQPKIQMLESGEGMMNAYREFTTFKGHKEIMTFFSFEVIGPEFQKMWDLFLDMYKKHRVAGRDLIAGDPKQHPFIKEAKRMLNYQIRQVAPGFQFFSDSIIYGNKVAFISHKKRFALIIESEDIVNSLRTLWELAWQSARPL